MDSLIFEPSVHIVAITQIQPEGLRAWIDAHGFEDTAFAEYAGPNEPTYRRDTPLGAILADVSVDAEGRSLDALPEFGGRFCYRAWDKGRSRPDYIANILESGHGSVLRHSSVSFAVSGVSRTLSHELVRHAAGVAPSQESQRYVPADAVKFVVPPLMAKVFGRDSKAMTHFQVACEEARAAYKASITCLDGMIGMRSDTLAMKLDTMRKKRIQEAARAHLPGCAETRLLWTMNMQAARFVCEQRGSVYADLEIRRLACAFTRQLKTFAPLIFADFEVYEAEDGFEATRCTHSKV